MPEAGLISLSLVLATVGLPLQLLPLLLTVDWLLSRARAMTNVTSDMLVAVVLDRLGRRAARSREAAETSGFRPRANARRRGSPTIGSTRIARRAGRTHAAAATARSAAPIAAKTSGSAGVSP